MALGYPWGGRPVGAPEVMGCFINTLVHPASAGSTRLTDVTADWWDDLDHATTPYDEVVRAARLAGGTWSGALHAILTFEDLGRRPYPVPGRGDRAGDPPRGAAALRGADRDRRVTRRGSADPSGLGTAPARRTTRGRRSALLLHTLHMHCFPRSSASGIHR
ncbi:hypothetical protein SALBM311S_05439 [Streptomyces alboniger]